MVALQEQKVQLELKQAEISLREIDHNQKIADKSIEAQAADRKDERQVDKEMHRQTLVFATGILVIVVLFVLAALYMNKDALVLDLAKIGFGFLGGVGITAAWHHRRTPKGDDNSD